MKLPTSRIASFLNKPDPAVRVILVYGPNEGLVRERALRLAKTVVTDLQDPFRVAMLAASTIADDPARLFDEMASLAFGGGRRLVRIQNSGEALAGAVTKLLDDMPTADSLLLIEAGDLDKRSKVRTACEGKTPYACAIPCYVEDASARTRTITEVLAREEIQAARDVVAVLAEILSPDSLAMRSELEKFAIFVGKGKVATMADVHASFQDAGAAEMDALIFAIGAGESKRAMQLIDRLYAEQISPVAILRAAQRHFMRVQWARAEMDRGVSAPDAVKRLQPPVFWKYESTMTSQLRRWSRAKTEQALRRLYDAEATVKRTGTPDLALCAQVLLGLAA